MYTLVVRIYAITLWIGLLLGFSVGYYWAKQGQLLMGLGGQTLSPIAGGLLGLFIAILILGLGLTLVGIFENTLATANAVRRQGGQQSGDLGISDSSQSLREALPFDARYGVILAFIVGALALVIWLIAYGPYQ